MESVSGNYSLRIPFVNKYEMWRMLKLLFCAFFIWLHAHIRMMNSFLNKLIWELRSCLWQPWMTSRFQLEMIFHFPHLSFYSTSKTLLPRSANRRFASAWVAGGTQLHKYRDNHRRAHHRRPPTEIVDEARWHSLPTFCASGAARDRNEIRSRL